MTLEICANSYISALNAQMSGAHRIELCQELSVGGLTPSFGMLKQVAEDINIPVHVLIRPRGGNFIYDESELKIMSQDIMMIKELGFAGIVSGVLKSDRNINLERTKELVELSKPLKFTFHRAFDVIEKPKMALEQLIKLDIDRVLTSGQESNAEKGLVLLKELKNLAKGRITILPGGGISDKNVSKFKKAGFTEIHASASTIIPKDESLFAMQLSYSDPKNIKAILNAI
ncbi:MAG: copper homeostasis protein CutC [Bacteroidota bacterium]